MTDLDKSVLERLEEVERLEGVINELRHIPHEDLQIFAASIILELKDKSLGKLGTKTIFDRLLAKNKELVLELRKAKK